MDAYDESLIGDRTGTLRFFVPERGSYFIDIYRATDGVCVYAVMIRHGETITPLKLVPGRYIMRMSVGPERAWSYKKRGFDPPTVEIPDIRITVGDKVQTVKEPR
ncbi:MAG: hypothetical protein R3C05_14120 [Pirellulaceae bacterium]